MIHFQTFHTIHEIRDFVVPGVHLTECILPNGEGVLGVWGDQLVYPIETTDEYGQIYTEADTARLMVTGDE